jgi:hypothetical protein
VVIPTSLEEKSMKTALTTIKLLAAILAIGLITLQASDAASARRDSNGWVRYYDDHGGDRGYSWCFHEGSCAYNTLEQCRAAISGYRAICELNPWAASVVPAQRPR